MERLSNRQTGKKASKFGKKEVTDGLRKDVYSKVQKLGAILEGN